MAEHLGPSQELHRTEVESAARRLWEADQQIQSGQVTPEKLQELGDAYQAYVKARVPEQTFKERLIEFFRDL